MLNFKDFNIETKENGLKGDKIKIERLIGREIVIQDFKLEDSKQVAGTLCLHLQIAIGENMHVVFTGSKGLIDQIRQVKRENLPFKATINKVNDFFKFT